MYSNRCDVFVCVCVCVCARASERWRTCLCDAYVFPQPLSNSVCLSVDLEIPVTSLSVLELLVLSSVVLAVSEASGAG